jgi:hypothetical protein
MKAADKRKHDALTALMTSSSLTEAAEKAGIDRRTLYNYIHNDLDFARIYRENIAKQAVDRAEELSDRRERASRVIMTIMEDEEQPPLVRLKAAQTILSTAAEQDRVLDALTTENISANKDKWDFSRR